MARILSHHRPWGGRPKGTSKKSKADRSEALTDAKNWCAMQYEKSKRHHVTIENKKRALKGVLYVLMQNASIHVDAPLAELNRATIKWHTKINCKLMCTHRGPLTLMHGVEAHIIKVVLLRGAMHQPVSYAEGLELANSLIKSTLSHAQLFYWIYQHLGKKYREDAATKVGLRRRQSYMTQSLTIGAPYRILKGCTIISMLLW
jgi:hypothetical protein